MKAAACLAITCLALCGCGPEGGNSTIRLDVTAEAVSSGLEAVRLTRVCGDGSCGEGRAGDLGSAQKALTSPGYSTYVGFGGDEYASATAVDSSGNAYMFGVTTSFGGSNQYVAKVSPAGQLIYFTYFSGGGTYAPNGIAVDGQGNACIIGFASSGTGQMYVAKLNASGSAFLFYDVMPSGRQLFDVVVDTAGNAYFVGNQLIAGVKDVYVGKLNSAGTAFYYSVTFGGSNADGANAIAIDGSGNAYVTGATQSTDFPVVNAFQGSLPGSQSAFVAKLNAAGTMLLSSTYLGGGGVQSNTWGSGVDVDNAGNIYVAGATVSLQFPVTSNAIQTSYSGGWDGFLTKLTPSGGLVFSTYVGGSGDDMMQDVAVDRAAGVAYVVGNTQSPNMRTYGAYQWSLRGPSDVYLLQVGPLGALSFASYFGGSGSESPTEVRHIALDASKNLYIPGFTSSTDLPMAVNSYGGGASDAFLTRFQGP